MLSVISKAEVRKLIQEEFARLFKQLPPGQKGDKGDEGDPGAPASEARLEAVERRVAALEAAKSSTLRTFRIANGTNATVGSGKDDSIIVQPWRSDLIAAAHKAGTRVLVYANASRASEPASEGNYNSGLTLKQARALGAATSEADSDQGGYVCLPGTQGYASAWANAVISRAKAAGADGVFLDDVNTSEGQESAKSSWNAQMQAFDAVVGPSLRAAGLLSIANLAGSIGQHNLESKGWVEGQFAYFDGALDEFFYVWPGGTTLQAPEYIAEALAVMGRQTRKGKLYLAQVQGRTYVPAALSAIQGGAETGEIRVFTPDVT